MAVWLAVVAASSHKTTGLLFSTFEDPEGPCRKPHVTQQSCPCMSIRVDVRTAVEVRQASTVRSLFVWPKPTAVDEQSRQSTAIDWISLHKRGLVFNQTVRYDARPGSMTCPSRQEQRMERHCCPCSDQMIRVVAYRVAVYSVTYRAVHIFPTDGTRVLPEAAVGPYRSWSGILSTPSFVIRSGLHDPVDRVTTCFDLAKVRITVSNWCSGAAGEAKSRERPDSATTGDRAPRGSSRHLWPCTAGIRLSFTSEGARRVGNDHKEKIHMESRTVRMPL